jgi:hypothetical protein
MLRIFRDLPLPAPQPRGLRYVDQGWVGCPATAPRDASIETCLACPELTGTVTDGGTIKAVRCQPRLASRVA